MQIAQQETWIRERAYAIWEQEGRPAGREYQHWFQAACEIGQTATVQAPAAKARAAAKSTPAKRRTSKARQAEA